jgi:hypothetical protein
MFSPITKVTNTKKYFDIFQMATIQWLLVKSKKTIWLAGDHEDQSLLKGGRYSEVAVYTGLTVYVHNLFPKGLLQFCCMHSLKAETFMLMPRLFCH